MASGRGKANKSILKSKSTENEDEVIRKVFLEEGLDDKVWIPEIREEFKLDAIQLLNNVPEEAFNDFVKQENESAVKTALLNVFKTVTGLGKKQKGKQVTFGGWDKKVVGEVYPQIPEGNEV